jgi:hypothetical protein
MLPLGSLPLKKSDTNWMMRAPGNASRTANENNLVNVGLVDLGISKDLFDGFESTAEEVLKFFDTGTSQRGVEINALVKRVDFN